MSHFDRLAYNPLTGVIKRLRKDGLWHSVGSLHIGGRYVSFEFEGKVYKNHRMAWFLTYGYWPKEIDHIDGNPTNNRLDNLREVPHSQNMANSRLYSNNSSGTKGVSWNKKRKKWRAYLNNIWIGDFRSKENAIKAREKMESKNVKQWQK